MTAWHGGPIFYVGIFCDRCGRQETGDVAAASQAVAEDGLRVDLATVKGWSCSGAGDFCPRCAPAPGVVLAEEDDRRVAAVELQAPNGERGTLIGPADRVAEVVRPGAVVRDPDRLWR